MAAKNTKRYAGRMDNVANNAFFEEYMTDVAKGEM